MDQAIGWTALAIVGLLSLAGGGWRWGGVQGPLIVVLACVGAAASLVTAFFVYGGFAWSSRGGGTMLLFALPAGVLAWVSFGVLGVVWRTRRDPRAFDGAILGDAARRLFARSRRTDRP